MIATYEQKLERALDRALAANHTHCERPQVHHPDCLCQCPLPTCDTHERRT